MERKLPTLSSPFRCHTPGFQSHRGPPPSRIRKKALETGVYLDPKGVCRLHVDLHARQSDLLRDHVRRQDEGRLVQIRRRASCTKGSILHIATHEKCCSGVEKDVRNLGLEKKHDGVQHASHERTRCKRTPARCRKEGRRKRRRR